MEWAYCHTPAHVCDHYLWHGADYHRLCFIVVIHPASQAFPEKLFKIPFFDNPPRMSLPILLFPRAEI